MTTEEMKQNLIDSIMESDAENIYKKQLLDIMQSHREKKLSDIEAYLFINEILSEYDFNVIMPYEQKTIEKKRKQELEKSCKQLPDIPIQNPEDVTEVAIKTKTKIGQIFLNGFNDYYRTIGIKNLNMRNREGNLITDTKQLKGGKQKSEAQEIIKQYCEIQKRPDLKRYAIQLVDIFEIPRYIEKEDKRGKNGFYIKHLMPIMVFYLLQKDKGVIYTNVEELSCFVGLVTKNYKRIPIEELAKINPRFTATMLNQFYYRCKPELESVIFRVLDILQDEYKALNYYRNYCIYTDDGSCHTSSKSEDVIIRQAEWKVLKEFNAKRILTIFQRKQQTKFYNRVCELINETYEFKWIKYKKQIQIIADGEALQEIMQDLTSTEISCNKEKIASRFARRIMNRTQSEYNRTNKKADTFETTWVEEQLKRPEFTELIQLGFDYENDLKKMVKEFDVYRYHDNYLTVQSKLIKLMIGEPEIELKDDIPELKEIL